MNLFFNRCGILLLEGPALLLRTVLLLRHIWCMVCVGARSALECSHYTSSTPVDA